MKFKCVKLPEEIMDRNMIKTEITITRLRKSNDSFSKMKTH